MGIGLSPPSTQFLVLAQVGQGYIPLFQLLKLLPS